MVAKVNDPARLAADWRVERRSASWSRALLTFADVARQWRDALYAEPKRARGWRVIAPAPCVAILLKHRRQQHEEQLLVGPEWEPHGLVSRRHRGKPLSHRNQLRAFMSLMLPVGCPLCRSVRCC